jgi:prepilin-type N-terminal cleavage/methylation domain-containing protein
MRWPARFRGDEGGFTLVELLIGMVIISLLIGAMGSALIVSLRTTDVTNQRLAENHDVQITSSYLANDVQSAADVSVANATTDCSGAFTTLVTFTYWAPGNPPTPTGPTAVYKCGTASGETRVTRVFNGTTVVVAHFAGAARPDVTVAYDPSQPTVLVSVKMTFTKASDCTLDCTYTLFGARRSFNPVTAGGNGSTVGDVVLLSTGTSSPVWVQGSCPNGGTDPTTDCFSDPQTIALPTADVTTTGWTTTPASPSSLFDKLNDRSDATWISTITQNKIAKMNLPAVNPPGGLNPTVEIRAASVGAAAKLKVHIYDSTTGNELVASGQINVNSSIDNSPDWTLSATERALIPDAAYQHLALGIEMTNNKSVNVYGAALNTGGPGLLTIKGPLLVNSQISTAVRLTGTKGALKLSIINGGDFKILSPGACSGCNHTTVACTACTWASGTQPWVSYTTSIPDPLRSLPAPDPATLGTGSCNGSGVCTPGVYSSTLSRTTNTSLQPGIYYLQNGMSITGTTSLTCPTCTGGQGVLLYIAGGSVTFAGSSNVNLPASNSGIYKNILMFQARSDTNEVKIAGNSGSGTTNVLGGVVYVPNSTQVTLATGSASLTAKAIVAQNIKVSSAVTIG